MALLKDLVQNNCIVHVVAKFSATVRRNIVYCLDSSFHGHQRTSTVHSLLACSKSLDTISSQKRGVESRPDRTEFSLKAILGFLVKRRMPQSFYYAVYRGRRPGIYTDWPSAEAQVKGFSNASHAKFASKVDAQIFLATGTRQEGPSSHGVSVMSCYRDVKDIEEIAVERNQAKLEGCLMIYADGSALGNGQDGARAGYGIYFGHEDARNVSARLPGNKQTNQRAELTAILRALQICWKQLINLDRQMLDSDLIIIRSDSTYAIKCITVWHRKWINNDYLNARGVPVFNGALIRKAANLCIQLDHVKPVRFQWVRGHSSDKANVCADKLAVRGSDLPACDYTPSELDEVDT